MSKYGVKKKHFDGALLEHVGLPAKGTYFISQVHKRLVDKIRKDSPQSDYWRMYVTPQTKDILGIVHWRDNFSSNQLKKYVKQKMTDSVTIPDKMVTLDTYVMGRRVKEIII